MNNARRGWGVMLVLVAGAMLAGWGRRPATSDAPTPQLDVRPAVVFESPPLRLVRSSKHKDITFDDIKFEMKKGDPFKREMLTEKIEKLDNQPIRIRGYILPSFQQKGITQFVLVRDNMECCFGPGAALYDCIIVEMEPGKSTSFTVRPVAVEGTFSIKPFPGPDGKHLAIYHLQGQSVE